MIAAVSAAFITNIQNSSAIPPEAKSRASVELAGGVPFVSDADLEAALEKAGASSTTAEAALDAYRDARLNGLRSALSILALLTLVALFMAQRIPRTQPSAAQA
jgi:hypothetical protein